MNKRSSALRILTFASLAHLWSAPLVAEPGQWEPVTRADLAGTPDLAHRDRQTLNMRTTGDFNGDGVADRAYVLINKAAAEYRVVVCLSRRAQPCGERTVSSGPIGHIATLGISTANEARLGNALFRSEEGAALGARMRQSGMPDFLHVFAFEASNAIYFLTRRGFEVVQVTD